MNIEELRTYCLAKAGVTEADIRGYELDFDDGRWEIDFHANGAEHDIHTLDCDSTVYYPYKTANDAPEGFVSSYSTYDNSGLPAGPICNPGLEAIKAAIYPSEEGSEYYFFCHDSDGTPYYASTMDEHLMNMAEAGLL